MKAIAHVYISTRKLRRRGRALTPARASDVIRARAARRSAPRLAQTHSASFVAGGEVRELQVLDGGQRSDHEPVLVKIAWQVSLTAEAGGEVQR